LPNLANIDHNKQQYLNLFLPKKVYSLGSSISSSQMVEIFSFSNVGKRSPVNGSANYF
jgi:hypothetical protein